MRLWLDDPLLGAIALLLPLHRGNGVTREQLPPFAIRKVALSSVMEEVGKPQLRLHGLRSSGMRRMSTTTVNALGIAHEVVDLRNLIVDRRCVQLSTCLSEQYRLSK